MPTALPQHCPSPRELDDLELLLTGGYAPRTAFDPAGAPDALVTLELPEELQGRDVELVDPEGLPLARLRADGSLTALSQPTFGPFRRLQLTPAQAQAAHPGCSWVPVDDALTTTEITRVAQRGPVVLLALTGHGTSHLSPVGLVRATLAAAAELPDAVVVTAPLPRHPEAPASADQRLREQVVSTYAGGAPVWPVAERRHAPTLEDFPPSVAAVVAREHPAPGEQGLVVFFTGLSGSGKSTIARALTDRILEQGTRTVTSLDGDVVRRQLSAGLTFSRADRETNIRRIGWVAAEVARHGGVAVCSPIAPFDETRQQVREYVEQAGGRFFLVHVATPLAECERRDRKGLYAKARAGEVPEFTGISSPYEEPADADLRVDTTGRTVESVVDAVADALSIQGLLQLPGAPGDGSPSPGSVPSPTPSSAPTETPPKPASTPPVAPAVDTVPTRGGRAAGEAPLAVLFVCTANICRSAYMEYTARDLVGNAVEFASAGTEAVKGRRFNQEMAAHLPPHLDPSTFRSHFVDRHLMTQADLVLCAERSHVDLLLERYPQHFRKIFTVGQFAETVRSSSASGRELLARATLFRAPQRPEHDVPDPYKRGEAAFARAAAMIDGFLREALVPLSGVGLAPSSTETTP